MSPVLEAAAAVTLVLGCLTAIGVLLKRVWSGLRKAVQVVDLIQKQLTPNGGGSVYDKVSTAAAEAILARAQAEHVAAELETFRQHQAEDSAAKRTSISQMQHDVTNIRAGQEMLLNQQLKTDARVTDHRDRNAAQVKALQAAVDDLAAESRSRDSALGEALRESLDVTVAVNDAQEP